MRRAFRMIALASAMLSLGTSQTTPAAQTVDLEAMERFMHSSTVRVVWSQEIARFDTDRGHSVITALVAEDGRQNPRRMRGIGIELLQGRVSDVVYTEEGLLERLRGALNEITTGLPIFRARASRGCFGSGVFWQQTGHAFSASACLRPEWSGLSVGTGAAMFEFTGLDAMAFTAAIDKAMNELKLH